VRAVDATAIVVGDVMVDVVVAVGELARGGDVHGRIRIRPGGSGANAAVWAAWTGADVALYGRIGEDLAGALVAGSLAGRDVVDALATDRSAPTGSMLVVVDDDDRSMVADRGANAHLSPGNLPEALEAGAVLVSGYLLFDPGSEPAAVAAVERARAEVVAVDAASWPLVDAYGPDRFLEATAGANLVLANEREARSLTGLEAEEAVRALARSHGRGCVKLGARGAVYSEGGEVLAVSPPEVEAVDPTGAGDAFDGVLVVALAAGREPPEALRLACEAGALAASETGNWPKP
jgi:sugar/nucleoside kinase (ribokinase family)